MIDFVGNFIGQITHNLFPSDFALAYAKHGELLDWLRKLGSFDEEATLFYASEILCALEFLHRCKIIHRDLKPENILVGVDWHIMVSDFGTAKILEEQPGGGESIRIFEFNEFNHK